jgi:hypothetical protein
MEFAMAEIIRAGGVIAILAGMMRGANPLSRRARGEARDLRTALQDNMKEKWLPSSAWTGWNRP